jgi:hypothetical protein
MAMLMGASRMKALSCTSAPDESPVLTTHPLLEAATAQAVGRIEQALLSADSPTFQIRAGGR